MIKFEVIDGQVTSAEDSEHNAKLQKEMAELESFSKSIGRSLGLEMVDRAVATFETGGFGLRYSTSPEGKIYARGVDIDERKSPSGIMAILN